MKTSIKVCDNKYCFGADSALKARLKLHRCQRGNKVFYYCTECKIAFDNEWYCDYCD